LPAQIPGTPTGEARKSGAAVMLSLIL